MTGTKRISHAPHHRHSFRLKGYDYSLAGAYFITIVTYQRACLFCEVVDQRLKLNNIGEIAREEWIRSAILRPNIHLYPDEFVVMPNHLHGIIWIDHQEDCKGAATLRPYRNHHGKVPRVISNSLGAIIRAYKSAVTYRVNRLRNTNHAPVWQRNYYDHIIRDEKEYYDICNYIDANPQNWMNDQYHPLLSQPYPTINQGDPL